MFCTNCGKELPDGSAFCTNCGMKISSKPAKEQEHTAEASQQEAPAAAEPQAVTQTQDETNWKGTQASDNSTATFSSEKQAEYDADAAARQIIGKNSAYYLEQFHQMRQGAKSKMNWASFLLGIWHAAYRNVWRDWLKAIRLPLILSIVIQALGILLMQVQPVLGIIVVCIGIPLSIWFWVAVILFAKRFNQIYMNHVEYKIDSHNLQPDLSVGRAVLTGFIICVAYTIIMNILSSFLMSALIGAFSEADEQTLEDMVPNQEIVDSIEPISPETDDSLGSDAYAINMYDYVGAWNVDRYNSYMDGYVGFVIENNNDQFYFSANGVWNQGDRVTNIDYAKIEPNYDGTQAGGYYQDDRGNTGDIILDFENGELYLTVTVDGSGNYSFAMSHEHCTKDASQVNLIENINADEQYAINIFLSNFSEVGFAYDTAFTGSDPNQIMHFAFLHNVVNNPEVIQYKNGEMSIGSTAISSTVQKYFNIDWQNQSTADYRFENDRYYTTAASGENYSICSIADTMYENEDKSYTVIFSIYMGPYDAPMTPYYSYSASQAESDPSLDWSAVGTATVGVRADDAGNTQYYLLSYEVLG